MRTELGGYMRLPACTGREEAETTSLDKKKICGYSDEGEGSRSGRSVGATIACLPCGGGGEGLYM